MESTFNIGTSVDPYRGELLATMVSSLARFSEVKVSVASANRRRSGGFAR